MRPAKKLVENLAKISLRIRHDILVSTTAAGSGHPTSSLSAVELMTVLLFGGFFRFNPTKPSFPNNDRLLFSKGHASPLFYSLYAAAGLLTHKDLLGLRKFNSPLEGHPSKRFRFTETPTGSLGQGLSIGVGMALNAKYCDKLPYKTYVLLGDSEMSEGQIWEAMQIAAWYKLNNLIAILDVNRLGQRGATMLGHNTTAYEQRIRSFGWHTITVNGHDIGEIYQAFAKTAQQQKPVMIIAKTLKGKGVSFLENKNGWHGKTLMQKELQTALSELGAIDTRITGKIRLPNKKTPKVKQKKSTASFSYKSSYLVATREAYGNALVRLCKARPEIVILDAEVSNSTYAEKVKEKFPSRFFEMFIAEQNMISVGTGMSLRGKIPFISSFAAFLTRGFDQIRMSQYAETPMVFCGSHAGTSIGQDGFSQMGIEDISMFASLLHSTILYPSDATSCEKLVERAAQTKGITYIRTTRAKTPVLYTKKISFPIGGSQTLKKSLHDDVTIIAAGITVHEALKAYDKLSAFGIHARIIDCYSVRPIDVRAIRKAAQETRAVFVVEDHGPRGGIADHVREAVGNQTAQVISLCVKKTPRSGSPEQLLRFEKIDADSIVARVSSFLKSKAQKQLHKKRERV